MRAARTRRNTELVSTLTVSFIWNERAKAWDIIASHKDGYVVQKRAYTTVSLDAPATRLVTSVVAGELEQLIEF